MAPVHEAAKRGDLAAVQAMIEEDRELLLAPSACGYLPHVCSAIYGHLAVTAYLLTQVRDLKIGSGCRVRDGLRVRIGLRIGMLALGNSRRSPFN